MIISYLIFAPIGLAGQSTPAVLAAPTKPLVMTATTHAPIPDPACKKYNKRDCREYELYAVPSADIDKYMVVGNKYNVPKEIEELQGLWYMNGNPLSDECFSLANSYYDPAKEAVIINVYEAGIWSFSPTTAGKNVYDISRTLGYTYELKRINIGWDIVPVGHWPPYLGNLNVVIPHAAARFTMEPTEDPNIWIKRSYFFNGEAQDYTLQRIVYPDGTRTPLFESDYLPNINSGKDRITLTDTQLLSRLI
jgi:hypothetical protein